MADELRVRERTRRILQEGQGLLRTLETVEMHLEVGAVCTLLCVDLVLEVQEELLELVDRVTTDHVRDEDRGFEDGRHTALILDLLDTLRDHFSNLRAHYLGHFAAILPEDISHTLLSELAVDTHVQFEVLVDQHLQEFAFAARKVREMPCRLVENDIQEVSLDLFDPIKIVLRELQGILRVVLKLDRALIGSEVFTGAKGGRNASLALLFPAASVTLNRWPIRVRFAHNFDPLRAAATVDA